MIDETAHKQTFATTENHFHSILALYQGFRRKKSNQITSTEGQEGRRAITHPFCVLIETILC